MQNTKAIITAQIKDLAARCEKNVDDRSEYEDQIKRLEINLADAKRQLVYLEESRKKLIEEVRPVLASLKELGFTRHEVDTITNWNMGSIIDEIWHN